MRRLILLSLLACAAGLSASQPAPARADLILSEYVEGSSNNKALEIWNHTGASVDLAAGLYKIQIYFNGAVTPLNTIGLIGTIANNDAFVLTHSSATATLLGLADQTSGSLSFNGDDAVVLVKGAGNTIVDAFGQIGFDPGTAWGSGTTSTLDHTLRRKSSVCEGDVVGSDVFDPSIQWDGFAVDDFSGLGAHSDGCGPTPVAPSTWGNLKSVYR
jgi:uncharacterized protein